MAPGRPAEVLCAQGRALVIGENLRTHTPTGSKLVRQMRAEVSDHRRILSTPAYAPDAHRLEWRWRGSRRQETHHPQRSTVVAQ